MTCLSSECARRILLCGGSVLSLLISTMTHAEEANACRTKGICGLTHIEALPFLKCGVQINYTGSIAKDGGNADNVWWLYQDAKTLEWVIFDVEGPGCIHQLYNHRGYPGYRGAPENGVVSAYNAPDTVYKFYFDGADQPQFTIKASEFGSLAGYEEPLTDMYLNWVKRTWFPMFYCTGCKITTSARLATPPGGWGTVVFHSYSTADGVPSFQEFSSHLPDVKRILTTEPGKDPKPTDGNVHHTATVTLSAQDKRTVLATNGCASIASCKLTMEPYNADLLQKIRIRLYFDDPLEPCVDVPFGAFFGNLRGTTNTLMVMQGLEIRKGANDGLSAHGYVFFPMPYWKMAKMELIAAADLPINVKILTDLAFRPAEKTPYPKAQCGYFRSVYREPFTPPDGVDTEYATIHGTGHVVSGTFASQAICEEDFRFYVDGCATAKIESDGAESWAGFGWGFCGPYSAPLVCQDKRNGWSQTRNLLSDCYPFYNRIDVRQENVWYKVNWGWTTYQPRQQRHYHGAIFYYGIDHPTLIQTDTLDVGESVSERDHLYHSDGELTSLTARYEGTLYEEKRFSGGFVTGEVTDSGRKVSNTSEFTVAIHPDNVGVRLRRRSDQYFGRQRARVFVDHKPVTERTWYRADRNPHLRWLEDEFEIPARYTKGKSKIHVKLVFLPTVVNRPALLTDPVVLPQNSLTEGHFGKALQGEVFQQQLTCLLKAPEEYTVDFWVRIPEKKPGIQHLMLWSGFWDLLTDNGYLVLRTDPKLGSMIKNPKNGKEEWKNVQHTVVDAVIADGTWHHVALSENGRYIRLFVDGSKKLEVKIERKQPFAVSGELTVGYRNSQLPFTGMLDELRFFNVCQDSVIVPTKVVEHHAEVVAHWSFDQKSLKSDQMRNEVAESPALIVRKKPPMFERIEMDDPATAWSEFFYWVFSYLPLPD